MAINVNFNYEAVTASRNLAVSQVGLHKAIERLSSGLRINRAADDAAGLNISEKLRAQVKGMTQAQRNAQDGISMLQVGEGSLNEIHSILQRMRELAVQSSSGTLGNGDRNAIAAEVTSLQSEIDRIGNSSQFNGVALLKGGVGGATVSALGASLTVANGINSIVASTAPAGTAYTVTTTALAGGQSTVTVSDGVLTQAIVVTVPTEGSKGVDFSTLGVSISVNTGLGSTAVAATNGFTVTANAGATLQIGANNNTDEQVTVTGINDMRAAGLLVDSISINVSTQLRAQEAINGIEAAIQTVSSARGKFGAYQNRLEHTINNLGVTIENMAASESRIRDADVAESVSDMTRWQILQQAGMGMLSQANAGAQNALSLLRG